MRVGAWCLLLLGTLFPGRFVQASTIVRFNTDLGSADVRLYDTATPASVANFLAYLTAGRYDGSFIHRSIPGFITQGGGFTYDEPTNTAPSIPSFPAVVNEPGISNLRGTIAYAKKGGLPDSATNQWFFNLADNSANLDFQNGGFTVFGRVIGSGMSVIDAIAALPTFDLDPPRCGPGDVFNCTFDNTPLENLPGGLEDDLVFVNSVELINLQDGDYDFGGTVDGTDLGIWSSDFGSTLLAEADGDGSGVVDGGDLLAWQRTFGQSSTLAASQAVPEPGSCGLAVVAMTILLLRGRTR